MTKTIDIDVLGNGEPYQFEPPVLEEESHASNNSFNGLKHECMIHFLYKWLLWKRPYIIEMNTFGNSLRKFCDLLSFPHAVSLFGFCCVRAHKELQMQNDIAIQGYYFRSFSVTHFDFCGDHMLLYLLFARKV